MRLRTMLGLAARPAFTLLVPHVVACASASAAPPLSSPPSPVPPATASAEVVPLASPAPPEMTDQSFCGAFLDAADVGARFQALVEPNVEQGLARLYARKPKPEGMRWVAAATWMDPHGNEPLQRVEETRWLFTDGANATRFIGTVVSNLYAAQSSDTVGPTFGDDCHVLKGTQGTAAGDAIRYVYVLRVERLVVKLVFTQGRRSPDGSLTLDLVVPVVRRAADKATMAQRTVAAGT